MELEQVQTDQDQHKELLEAVTKDAKAATASVEALISKVKAGPDTRKGISFLQMKNSLLLEYISNLSYLMLRKTYGKKIEGDQAIERLVKLRTIMEKIRPIDQKMKYQVDKLISIAESGHVSADDPLLFKANPDNLLSKQGDSEDEDSDEDGDEEGKKSDQKYVAPKNIPRHFDGDKTSEELEQEKEAAAKKHRISKSLIDDLKRQHLDTPEEVHHHADVKKNKFIQEEKERTRYEEENFIRLPVTKEEKQKRRIAMSTMGSIGDDITSFGSSNFNDSKFAGAKKRKSDSHGKAAKHVKKSAKKSKFKKRKF